MLQGNEAFWGGLLIKVIDDTLDDGIWVRGAVVPCTGAAVALVVGEMRESVGKSVMMAAFTAACCETKGIDNVYFAVAAGVVFATAAWRLLATPSFFTDFHQQMCLLGTTYAGTLATRLDSLVDTHFGFYPKTLFRLILGLSVTQARPFVPTPYLPQHDFLVQFIFGYFVAQILSIPQLWYNSRTEAAVCQTKRKLE